MKQATSLAIAAALALSSCGGTDEPAQYPQANADEESWQNPAPQDPTPEPSSETPALDDGMAYHFRDGQRGPSLSYGVPDTDNVALGLKCAKGDSDGSVTLSFNRPADIVARRPDTLTLSAGQAEQDLAIETRTTQLGTTVEVQTKADRGPLRAFRQGAPLEVIYGDEVIRLPATDNQGRIGDFFEACT